MGLFHPDAISPSKLPRMTTKEDYQLGQSTKINTVIKLIRHHLSGSTESPVFDVDGDHQWPPSATTTLPSSSIRPRPKIVVYQSFTSLSGFLQKCFTVNDIRSILVNGGMSFEQRSAAIEKFRTDPDINVLILSAVGSVGLNLAFASAIAFMVCQHLNDLEYPYLLLYSRIRSGVARIDTRSSVDANAPVRKTRLSSGTFSLLEQRMS